MTRTIQMVTLPMEQGVAMKLLQGIHGVDKVYPSKFHARRFMIFIDDGLTTVEGLKDAIGEELQKRGIQNNWHFLA